MQRRRTLFDRSESDLAVAKIELIMLVTSAYLSVLVADDTVKQFAMESEALQKQLEEAEALYARALLPLTQVLETQTRSETVKSHIAHGRTCKGGRAWLDMAASKMDRRW